LGIRSSVDGSFNRGMVEEKLNDNQYKVVLFDSGTKDIVSSNSFVEIPEYVKQVHYIFIIYDNSFIACIKICNLQVIYYVCFIV